MSYAAERKLVDELSERIHSRLLPDPGYSELLRAAGLRVSMTGPNVLDRAAKDRLREAVARRMHLLFGSIVSLRVIDPNSLRFAMLADGSYYRAANASDPTSLSGMWWFDQSTWERCGREAGSSDRARIDWLHEKLAVCYDWSTCDRIVRIETSALHPIPALLALGTAVTRVSSPGMYGATLPGIGHQSTIHGGLNGGVMQIILPFVPRRHIRNEALFVA